MSPPSVSHWRPSWPRSGSVAGPAGGAGSRNRSWLIWAGGCSRRRRPSGHRIARELHDGISQQLAVLALELDALAGPARRLGGIASSRRGLLAQRTRTIAADVQQVTRGLHPARLEHLGLVPAVRALGHEMEHSELHVDVAESDWPARLPSVVALSLYRVAQEALHNAVKHSGAGVLSVSFRGGNGALTLTISDAGRGFDPQGPEAYGGLGIVSMRQRLRAIGGSLRDHCCAGTGHSCTGSPSSPGATPATRRAPGSGRGRRPHSAIVGHSLVAASPAVGVT